MIERRAQLLGALLGAGAMAGWAVWSRLRPPPCTGGVTVELRPPLVEPGPYHFAFLLDDMKSPCEFDVALPVRGKVPTPCGLALELKTRVAGTSTSITALTIGASPDTMTFRVSRSGERLFDAELTPKYGPYETPREESRLFCGDRALVTPPCLRGSSACGPFEPACDGPEDCPKGKVCCLSPDSAREYGPAAASECSGSRSCTNRFGAIACHGDSECPKDMSCSDRGLAGEFKRAVVACRPKR